MLRLRSCKYEHLKFRSSFVNFSLPRRFNCHSEQGVEVWRGAQTYQLCIQYIVPLRLAWVGRGMSALYISISGQ